MPRIAETRPAAAPSTDSQIARRERIIAAATELGASHGYDAVQMSDVAKNAGVAMATLYRYFPSKTHLFTAVIHAEVATFEQKHRPRKGRDPVEAVADFLTGLSRHLLRRPPLAAAMLQAADATHSAATIAEADLSRSMLGRIVLRALGVEHPTDRDVSITRLLLYCWWGCLVATLNGQLAPSTAEADVRLGVRLILAPYLPQSS